MNGLAIACCIVVPIGIASLAAHALHRERSGLPARATLFFWRAALLLALLFGIGLGLYWESAWLAALCALGMVALLSLGVHCAKAVERARRRKAKQGEFHPDAREAVDSFWKLCNPFRVRIRIYPVSFGVQAPGVLLLLFSLGALLCCWAFHWAQNRWTLSWVGIGAGVLWCMIAFLRIDVDLSVSEKGLQVRRKIWGFEAWQSEARWEDVRCVVIGSDGRQNSLWLFARGLWLFLQCNSVEGERWYPHVSDAILESIQGRPEEGGVLFLSAARMRWVWNAFYQPKGRKQHDELDNTAGVPSQDGHTPH